MKWPLLKFGGSNIGFMSMSSHHTYNRRHLPQGRSSKATKHKHVIRTSKVVVQLLRGPVFANERPRF